MRRSSSFVLAASLLALAGCATDGPEVRTETVTVKVAVPVPCVKEVPQPAEPFLPREAILQGTGGQVVLKYDRELAKHQVYELALTEALTGCSTVPDPAAQAPAGAPDVPPASKTSPFSRPD